MAKANRPYRNHTVFVVVLFFQFRRSDGSNILVGPWCASVCVCLCWWRCVCFIFHAYKFFWLDSRLLLLELLPLPLLGDCYWKGPNDCVHTQTRTIRIICILIAKFCVCIVSFSTIVCVASVFSIHQFVVYGCFKLRLLLPHSSLSQFVVLFRFCLFIAGNFISFFFGIFVIKTCLLSPSSFFAHTLSVPLLPTFSLATFLLSLHSVRIQ